MKTGKMKPRGQCILVAAGVSTPGSETREMGKLTFSATGVFSPTSWRRVCSGLNAS